MKPFVAVIGGASSGKSTIIKSLTGCPKSNFRGFLTERTKQESIYVSASSPQENPDTLKTVAQLNAILNQVSNNKKCHGIAMAIQPTNPWSAKLSMEKIINAVSQYGGFSIFCYVLDPEWGGTASHSIKDIKKRLKSVPAKFKKLDARKFAFLNARPIRNQSKIV